MSVTAAISYRSLKDAASESKKTASRLTQYADELNRSVYKKLNSYRGDQTDNLETAKSKTNDKITELREKSQAYTVYANDLSNLKNICENTDREVRAMVSHLTADFKTAHGIDNNGIINTINYILESTINSTSVGRWLNNKKDTYESIKKYIKESIEDWWEYNGGREMTKGKLVACLEIALGVIDVVGAIVAIASGVTLLGAIAVVAAVIGGAIAITNGIINYKNEKRAYEETRNGDPASGRRLSNENTLQDTLRKETDSEFWHDFADSMDVVKTVCDVIGLVNAGVQFLGKGYQWLTGNKFLGIKNMAPEMWKGITGKLTNLGQSIKGLNLSNLVKDLKTDFVSNLKDAYSVSQADDAKNLSAFKNWLNLSKDLLNGEGSFGYFFKNIFSNGKSLFSVMENGKTENVTVNDFTSLLEKTGEILDSDAFKYQGTIAKDILKRLRETCNINISIPENFVPQFKWGV